MGAWRPDTPLWEGGQRAGSLPSYDNRLMMSGERCGLASDAIDCQMEEDASRASYEFGNAFPDIGDGGERL